MKSVIGGELQECLPLGSKVSISFTSFQTAPTGPPTPISLITPSSIEFFWEQFDYKRIIGIQVLVECNGARATSSAY